ncbi:MAG: hypothetical protein ACXWP5_01130, partial [Bdellovibrionota bacterium]
MRILISAILFLATLTSAKASTAPAVEATEGQVTQGSVLYRDLAIPEAGQVGFVELTLVEDGTRQQVIFRQEDRSCVLVSWLNCEREAKRLGWLQPGMHLRVQQNVSFWTGRRTMTIETLAEETDFA